MQKPTIFACLAALLGMPRASSANQVPLHPFKDNSKSDTEAASWCDRGCHEASAQQSFHTFDGTAVRPEAVLTDDRCDGGLVFLQTQGWQAYGSQLAVFDGRGDLVWKPTRWTETRDVRVQSFNDSLYMTFWVPDEDSHVGHYVMLDESYEVVREIRPEGGLQGDSKNLLITNHGTAILTVDPETHASSLPLSSPRRREYGSVFQEIDLESNKLLFEWHASDKLAPTDSRNMDSCDHDGGDTLSPLSVIPTDKDPNGGAYLVSSPCAGAVLSVSAIDGHVQWQLGGASNSFKDLSDGQATKLPWQHRATWATVGQNNKPTLTIVGHDRTVVVELDLVEMTATLSHVSRPAAHALPRDLRQGSTQVLPNGNILVSGASAPGFAEFSHDGQLLCETRLGPTRQRARRAARRDSARRLYRASKFDWTGHPDTKPSIAVRPGPGGGDVGGSLYVSWNGATEVGAWVLQSGPTPDGNAFINHFTVARQGFETKISLPLQSEDYLRVLALDKNWHFLGRSDSVSRRV